MPICKFFLQGRCKFGDNCRFIHENYDDYDVNYGPTNKRTYQHQRQYYPDSHENQYSSNRYEVLAQDERRRKSTDYEPKRQEAEGSPILKAIEEEMLLWINSGMWQLSSFSFQKEYPCVEGFIEYSAEEVRFKAWQSFETYMKWFRNLCIAQREKQKIFVNPSYQVRHQLDNVIQRVVKAYEEGLNQPWPQQVFAANVSQQNHSLLDDPFKSSVTLANSRVFPTATNKPGPFMGQMPFQPSFGSVSLVNVDSVFQQSTFEPRPMLFGKPNNATSFLSSSTPVAGTSVRKLFLSETPDVTPVKTLFGKVQNVQNEVSMDEREIVRGQEETVRDGAGDIVDNIFPHVPKYSTNLPECERLAYESDEFVLGKIPVYPPPQQFSK